MAEKNFIRCGAWASTLVLALCVSSLGHAQSQNFQMRVDRVTTFTPFYPRGIVDPLPPYTVCRGNAITFRFKYTWNNNFQEYIYTEPGSTFYPYYYMQAASPNPLLVPAVTGGGPAFKTVEAGLITGPVNTLGVRTLTFRGRTSGFFGQPVLNVTVPVQIETQFEPNPTQYRELRDGALDMPTRPWFAWSQSGNPDSVRYDLAQCSDAAATSNQSCNSNMPNMPLTDECGNSLYCQIGTANELQLPITLTRDTAYAYRVLGRNVCGISNELEMTPARPFFRTAQACFDGGFIPDGGIANFDVSTLGLNPGSLVPNLRVTVHSNHTQVSDLRISLTKTFPDSAGPLLLMDRPNAPSCSNRRIQAVFKDGGLSAASACQNQEPAIGGSIAPIQALASFAPIQGGGNWRLTVEDTNANGKAGSLLQWCLSADVPVSPTAYSNPLIWANGFE